MLANVRSSDLAAFVLRIALGLMFLSHSLLLKLGHYGLAGTAQYFTMIGLPGWLAYVVFAVEAVGGLMLILGVEVRWASIALLPVLLGATWAHSGNGWVFNAPHGGWEYPLYLVVLAGVQALLGEGAFALKRSEPLPFLKSVTA